MVCVYHGCGPTDAYLVRDWLERNDIRAWVRGHALLGAMGQVPVAEAWPSVWVSPNDEDRAADAVRAFHGPALVHPVWRCGCGEENAPAFGSCWSCGADRPNAA